jgi:hypothetical protein
MKVKRKTRTRTRKNTYKSKVRSKVSRRSTKRKNRKTTKRTTYKRKNRKTTKRRNRKLRGGSGGGSAKKDADPTPGSYRVVGSGGVLARAGVETSSDAVTKLEKGVEIEVVQVVRRSDDVVRLCFTKAGLKTAPGRGRAGAGELTDATQQLWVSERKTDGQTLLKKIESKEERDIRRKREGLWIWPTYKTGRKAFSDRQMFLPDDHIYDIKHRIESIEGMLVGDQILKFKGQELIDDRTLAYYNIKQEDTLNLSLTGTAHTLRRELGLSPRQLATPLREINPLGVGGDATHHSGISVTVNEGDGMAGFVANEGLILTSVGENTPCSKAGVTVGMHVHSFQAEVLTDVETWSTLKDKVKKTAKPWKFTFAGSAGSMDEDDSL